MSTGRLVFAIVSTGICAMTFIAAFFLRIWVMMLLRKDDPAKALLFAGCLPSATLFRLRNDDIIDHKLLRLANLHDKLQKLFLFSLGIAIAIIIVVVFIQE